MQENNFSIEDITTIGIASPGSIIENKIISNVVNLKIEKFDIYTALKKHFPNTKIIVKNDGCVAAIAEKLYGNIKNYKDALFICLGTGVGGTVFLNGKMLEPKKYSGLEIGHMSINKNGPICKCGKRGCFDIYGSFKKFKEELAKKLEWPIQSTSNEILPKLQQINKLELNSVEKIIQEYTENLSIGISNLINLFEPEIICIGGSFSYYESILLKPLKKKILEENMLFNKRKDIKIVCAKFLNDAGIIGAGNIL